ncbi:MAG: epimerase [Sulfitobacter sp.]|nr:MAG: epimerase [Sulfitobacter sp.]
MRDQRVKQLESLCKVVPNCPFGSQAFSDLLLATNDIDAYCHHGAQTENYKSLDFDEVAALAANTRNIRQMCQALVSAKCKHIILTGTVFEKDEGNTPHPTTAATNYGLSKTLTAISWTHFAEEHGISLVRFVIPNPFGPFEEPRFTSYLVKTWAAGKTATVNTPDYIRDNIPVSLLAKHYASIVQHADEKNICDDTRPSFFVETQGAFAQRFANEMKTRLNLACDLKLKTQTQFSEPLKRVNNETLDPSEYKWNEAGFWDELADYYRQYVIDQKNSDLS